jgi:DNA-binding IclR family transcriptional regulator
VPGSDAWHVVRTLRAMEVLALRPRSAPELAGALGIHARTARRLLKRLESEGYVALGNDRRRRYRPTMRVVALAGQVVERAELTQTAVPHVGAARAARRGLPCLRPKLPVGPVPRPPRAQVSRCLPA